MERNLLCMQRIPFVMPLFSFLSHLFLLRDYSIIQIFVSVLASATGLSECSITPEVIGACTALHGEHTGTMAEGISMVALDGFDVPKQIQRQEGASLCTYLITSPGSAFQ